MGEITKKVPVGKKVEVVRACDEKRGRRAMEMKVQRKRKT